jgi:hypothetical protein
MPEPTLTGSKTIAEKTNGHALRKCPSWIESFIDSTEILGSPRLFRKWAAISVIGAVLEQKVYMISAMEMLYPNIYCFLIGHPGVGKTRSIRLAKRYYLETDDPRPAPTSMTASSMIDALAKSKRTVVLHDLIKKTMEQKEYNTLYITADEMMAFMHEYNHEAAGVMSDFYDPQPYGQTRRKDDLNIKIKSPQLNLICGATPSTLMTFMPASAWEQGLTSRIVMVFSDERYIGDDFADSKVGLSDELVHDLRCIGSLLGPFYVSQGYRDAINNWRGLGEPPMPTHPRLIHYATRRKVHLYKLSMICAVDRGGELALTPDDFNRALEWLIEAEHTMPDVFKAGSGNADARAMDEIYYYVLTAGLKKPVSENRVVTFAKEHIPLHSIERVIKVMVTAGMLQSVGIDKYGLRLFKARVPERDEDGNKI